MFSESIIAIGLAQSLFAAFVLATRKERSVADWILVTCLLTMALKFALFMLYQRHAEYFDLQFSMGLIPLSFGPFLYLYTVYLIEGKTKFDARDLLHYVPMVTLTTLYLVFFKEKVDFTDVSYFVNDDLLWVRIVFGLIVFTSIVVYTVLTFMKLREFRRSLSEQYSYENREIRLLWLNFIFILFMILFATHFITGGINAVSYQKVIDTTTLSHVGLTLIALAISYFGLQQKAFYIPKESGNTLSMQLNGGRKTVSANQATTTEIEDLNAHLSNLNKHMAETKPYLNPELTLNELAGQININKQTLTYLLNHHVGKNFFTFVNEYRLEAVMARLEDPEYEHFTIMAIALDCGFNSKSTFNSLFKRYTGKTPSDFKKAIRARPPQP